MRNRIKVVPILLLLLWGGHVTADPLEAAALRMGKAAEELFLGGKYSEAKELFYGLLQRFERPVDLIDTAWWNLGRCHEEMGNDEAALAAFTQYAKRVRNPGDQEAARDKLQQVQARLQATLRLQIEPEDVTVHIDGELMGTASGTFGIRLPQGRHVIRVTKPGHEAQEVTVDLAPRETRALAFSLGVTPVERVVQTERIVQAQQTKDAGLVVGGRSDSERTDWTKMRIGGVAATAAGGLIALVGIVPLVLAHQDRMWIRDEKAQGLPASCYTQSRGYVTTSCYQLSSLESRVTRQRLRSLVGYVLEGVGAATAMAGATVLVVDRVRRPFRRVDVSLTPVPGGAVAGISGAF